MCYVNSPSMALVVLIPLTTFLCFLPSAIDHVAHYKSSVPCQYSNESSFIKWLNGPDKSPNEEINNSVIVAVLILIRSSCSALIPARRVTFVTVFSSACQHCCSFFSFPFIFEINDVPLETSKAVSRVLQYPINFFLMRKE